MDFTPWKNVGKSKAQEVAEKQKKIEAHRTYWAGATDSELKKERLDRVRLIEQSALALTDNLIYFLNTIQEREV